MRCLFVLNDPPYGTERSYNGLRLAMTLAKQEDVQVDVFLMADAVFCGKAGQNTPDGYYNLDACSSRSPERAKSSCAARTWTLVALSPRNSSRVLSVAA